MHENFVCVAVREDGCVGYFQVGVEVPEGWRKLGLQDIFGVMTASHLTKDQTLAMMNQHWQKQ